MPGGASQGHAVSVTTSEAATRTLAAHKQAFAAASLGGAWSRVVGLVVQPGVEFDNISVTDYQPEEAASLARWRDASADRTRMAARALERDAADSGHGLDAAFRGKRGCSSDQAFAGRPRSASVADERDRCLPDTVASLARSQLPGRRDGIGGVLTALRAKGSAMLPASYQ